jgi:predicted histone-like DNA-binding protein
MAVQYKMVPKKNNLVNPPEVKFYPCALSQGEVNLDDLAMIVADRSTMSPADCHGVIRALSDVIGETLGNGKIVRIDNLGTFNITLLGIGAESDEPMGRSKIKEAKVRFRPAKHLKSYLKNFDYKKV